MQKCINGFAKLYQIRQNNSEYSKSQLPIEKIEQSQFSKDNLYICDESIKNICTALSNLTGRSFLGCCLAMLGAISNATRGRVNLCVNDTWSEPAVDMMVHISESGTMKSKIVEILKRPFIDFCEHENIDENREKNRQYFLKKEIIDRIERKNIKKIISNVFDTEHLCTACEQNTHINEIDAVSEKANIFRKNLKNTKHQHEVILFIDSATGIGLVKNMSEQGECCGVLSSEGDILSSDIFTGKNYTDIVLKSYGKEPHTFISGRCNIKLKHPAFPCIVFAQPSIACEFYLNAKMRNKGVCARFIPCFDSNLSYAYRNSNYDFSLYNDRIKKLLEIYYTQNANAEQYNVSFENEATNMIYSFREQISAVFMPSMPNTCKEAMAKVCGQAVRLAWDLHAANPNNTIPHETKITVDEVKIAISLMNSIVKHIEFMYSPTGFKAYLTAYKIIESYKTVIDWDVQNKLQYQGSNLSILAKRIGENSTETLSALKLLQQLGFVYLYDDGSSDLRFALYPSIYSLEIPKKMSFCL